MRAALLRGLAAGLIAGVLAGLVGLVLGEPALESAIALEAAAEPAGHVHDGSFPRPVQRAGLVVGSGLLGAVLGLAFGVASAWAVGRLDGDGWARSLKLGAVAVTALALAPAVLLPANPPGVGDPATVGTRTGAYLGLAVAVVALAAAGRLVARELAGRGVHRAVRQAGLAGAGAGVLALVVGLGPDLGVAAEGFPADLLWRFRLGALATQLVLHGGLAVAFGLLAVRAERTGRAAPAAAP